MGLTAFLFFFLVERGFLLFSMTAYSAKQSLVMRGRSPTLMSNSSFWSHSGSEHTLTSLLVTILQSSSPPWKRPAWTTNWGRDQREAPLKRQPHRYRRAITNRRQHVTPFITDRHHSAVSLAVPISHNATPGMDAFLWMP